MLLSPTSVPIGQPLECSLCQNDLCYPHWDQQDQNDPQYNQFFVRKYCQHDLPTLVLYFPFFLLVIAGILTVIDRPFVSYLFKSFNIDDVYKILVHKGELNLRNRSQEQILLRNLVLNTTSKYHSSYLWRTLLSIIFATGSIALLFFTFLPLVF